MEKKRGRKKADTVFTENINVKCTSKDKEDLQKICSSMGAISLSDLIRMVVYPKLERYRKTGDYKSFMEEKQDKTNQ